MSKEFIVHECTLSGTVFFDDEYFQKLCNYLQLAFGDPDITFWIVKYRENVVDRNNPVWHTTLALHIKESCNKVESDLECLGIKLIIKENN